MKDDIPANDEGLSAPEARHSGGGEAGRGKGRVKGTERAEGVRIEVRVAPGPEERNREDGERKAEEQMIPARMLNEFVYCPRLFYYEFVEGVFLESADTLRGSAIHQRVDGGSGKMPEGAGKAEGKQGSGEAEKAPGEAPEGGRGTRTVTGDEVIHSRSVKMASERLGVVAKMDLVEVRAAVAGQEGVLGETPAGAGGTRAVPTEADLFEGFEVCPVDYKAGSPKEGEEQNELWDTDRMQLGLQALVLRENGFRCEEGVIYYRGTKQRVRLRITPELVEWIEGQVAEARKVMRGPIPGPLVNSPKCARCSLAPICLPDETRLLSEAIRAGAEEAPGGATSEGADEQVRRLMAARDDARALYLNTPGLRVGVKSDCLQVKEREKVVDQVRVRDVSHVALFGNIQISTQAVQTLCEHETPITYFSMGGWFYGITRGHELKNVFLRKRQFEAAEREKECVAVARRFVHGKARNHRTMLMRNHVEPTEVALRRLKVLAENALGAESLQELLGVEGAAASLYFEHFNGMLKVGDELDGPRADAKGQMRFHFENRTRRPPTDPVNALLSMAYSVLAKDCAIAAMAVGFDPYIGFYHQPRFGRPALALDLMEEFRPLIAESAVLNCINTRVVTESDFVRAGKAVNLTSAGRKKFFQSYEQRITGLVTHPVFEYKVSYRRALELQARVLAKYLTGETGEYVPFTTR